VAQWGIRPPGFFSQIRINPILDTHAGGESKPINSPRLQLIPELWVEATLTTDFAKRVPKSLHKGNAGTETEIIYTDKMM